MKTTNIRRLLSLVLCIVLIAATALFAGCGDNKKPEVPEDEIIGGSDSTQVMVLGVGKTSFSFNVKDLDGNETDFEIHTDKTNVADALSELGLIKGEEGEYGLYVKEVNGIPESDGAYWMIYVNGEMAPVGISQLEIKNGETYSLRLEKF